MMIKLFKENKIGCINIVRRQEQVDLLMNSGSEYVLNSNDPDFDKKLVALTTKFGASVALEAVSGEMPGHILNALPRKGVLI